jgi:hypothetical protein
MSDLQLGLLAIGVAVVVGVLAYNKWQEAKLRRRSEAAFGSRHGDVLLRGATTAGEVEPPPAPRPAPSPVDRTLEHTLGEMKPMPAPTPERQPEPEPPASVGLDPAVDYIVALDCARPVSGSEVARQGRALVDEGLIKPVQWEGYEDSRAAWRPLSPVERYRRLRVGLQLANRAGPVSEEDLLAFCGAVQEVALALAAEPDFPDPDEAMARAQALDHFCAEVDVQIGLSVIGSESHTFSGSRVRTLAEAAGLAIGRDGRFHRHAEDGSELFSLANLEPMPFHPETIKTLQTRGVTVLFDVPRVPESASAFRRFIEFAHQLEQSLGGVLVDDNRRPIGQAALETIAQQLERIHQTMAARGIPAGSPLALRLFG